MKLANPPIFKSNNLRVDFLDFLELIKTQKVTTYKEPALKIVELFRVDFGFNENIVDQVIERSTDKEDMDLQRAVGDMKRFSTKYIKEEEKGKSSYERWYSKNDKHSYALIDEETEKIISTLWFNMKDKEMHEIHLRIYPGYRGKGIAKLFALFCLNKHLEVYKTANIKVHIAKTNFVAIKVYEDLGFISLNRSFIQEKIVFYGNEDIKGLMTKQEKVEMILDKNKFSYINI